jgi:hypothetical protein
MGMLRLLQCYRSVLGPRINHHPTPLLFACAVVALNFSVCSLRHAPSSRTYSTWRCEAVVRDARTLEPFRVTSEAPFNPLPVGSRPRLFIMRDWDGDGDEDFSDVITDWRRYIANRILRSGEFAGRDWCVDTASINCTEAGTFMVSTAPSLFPPTLPPVESLPTCPREPSGALLEVSAPGLTPAPDFRLSFTDTPVGLTGAPVTIRLRNARSIPLRINGTDLLGQDAEQDFIEPVGSNGCLPRADEMRRGVGRELSGGDACSFQVQFRPQFRPGVGECDRDDTTSMSCNRVARLQITSATIGGNMLPPTTLNLSGRAIGGRLVVEPASREICFTPRATPLTPLMCTEERTVTIRNEGARSTTGNITITSSGAVPALSYYARPPSLEGTTLTPGDSRTLLVQYCERGERADGVYRIFSSAPLGPNPVDIAIFNPNNRTCP